MSNRFIVLILILITCLIGICCFQHRQMQNWKKLDKKHVKRLEIREQMIKEYISKLLKTEETLSETKSDLSLVEETLDTRTNELRNLGANIDKKIIEGRQALYNEAKMWKDMFVNLATKSLLAFEQVDYIQLMLEQLFQQKIYRSLWKPTEARPFQNIILMTDLHNPPQKNNEPLIALQTNLMNPLISQIHLLVEIGDVHANIDDLDKLFLKEKIHIHKVNKRLTPSEMFDYSNRNQTLHGKIVMIANSDIIFDHTLINMREFPKDRKVMWSISRRRTLFDGRKSTPRVEKLEIHPDMCFHYVGSHDGFAYVSPVDEKVLETTNDFYLGEWGCENRIMHAFESAGYIIENPCFKINLWHYATSYYPKKNNRRVNVKFNTKIPPLQPDPELGIELMWQKGLHVWDSQEGFGEGVAKDVTQQKS